MMKIKVGITIGDPSGIGPEITLKALRSLKGLARFVVIADTWVLERAGFDKCKSSLAEFIDLKNIRRDSFKFGRISAEYGRASIEYLDKALQMADSGEIDCLVTCPISKESIYKAGYRYSGHTEYLAERLCIKNQVMMLSNDKLRFSLVTRHIPLKEVPSRLNKEDLRRNINLTESALRKLFLIKSPRIIVCGLNPHASDNGVIGDEENRIVKPLLRSLKKKIKLLDGPISADVAIAMAAKDKYDCVIAMYHDQALIPLKLFGNSAGVNLTLGLPFVRTSPLHGTAFDIAGLGLAKEDSLNAAIRQALKCTSNLKKA